MSVGQRSYTDQERQSVLSMQLEGIGPSEISRRSGVALRTVERWCESWREVADEVRDQKLLSGATELALRGQALQHDLLDAYEGMPASELVKHANNLNNLTGTNLDKVLAITGKTGGNVQVGPFILAIMPNEEPDSQVITVDAEAAHIE